MWVAFSAEGQARKGIHQMVEEVGGAWRGRLVPPPRVRFLLLPDARNNQSLPAYLDSVYFFVASTRKGNGRTAALPGPLHILYSRREVV